VLEATGTQEAVLVAFSCGVSWALQTAVDRPAQVRGIFAIAPSCGFTVPRPGRDMHAFDARVESPQGWARYNRHHWLEGGYADFVEFFLGRMFSEPHSTKQVEDATGWAHDVGAATLADATAGRLGCDGVALPDLEQLCARVRCPVGVLHGTGDRVTPAAVGERLAELTGAAMELVPDAGHGLPMRRPVLVNLAVSAFVHSLDPAVRQPAARRAGSRRRGPA